MVTNIPVGCYFDLMGFSISMFELYSYSLSLCERDWPCDIPELWTDSLYTLAAYSKIHLKQMLKAT